MKGGVEHRVPLAPRAVELLQSLPLIAGNEFVFPAAQSPPTIARALARMGRKGVTCHGFRSCFMTWATESTSAAHEVREACLAHKIPSAVERAYKRTDFLDARRQLMDAWERYCTMPAAANVVPIRSAQG
jgi:integrase